jgi:hypothetical protein
MDEAGSVLFRPHDLALDAALGGVFGGVSYGYRSLQIRQVRNLLSAAAGRAQARVGPGSGHAYGSRVHAAFAQEVRALGRADILPEVSYFLKEPVTFGTRGSIRVDVLYGTIDRPIAAFDLKTGSAGLTTRRMGQIQSHLPFRGIPVFEVRP